MTIDSSYFINDIAIANTSQEVISGGLDAAIVKYEKEALLSVLGYELYELYIAAPTDPPYDAITNGAEFEFEFGGKTVKRKWVGLANQEKISLLAYYVYFQYEKQRNTINSSIGHVKALPENATQENPRLKFINAWNNYIYQKGYVQNVGLPSRPYLYGSRVRSGELPMIDKFNLSTYRHFNDDPSLYNFLLANISDYPKWEFTPEEKINLFDV